MTDRWKNRRRMAWAALVAGMLFPLLLLWSQSDQLGAVAGAFYVFVTGVVSAYIGFATYDDVETDRQKKALNHDSIDC